MIEVITLKRMVIRVIGVAGAVELSNGIGGQPIEGNDRTSVRWRGTARLKHKPLVVLGRLKPIGYHVVCETIEDDSVCRYGGALGFWKHGRGIEAIEPRG